MRKVFLFCAAVAGLLATGSCGRCGSTLEKKFPVIWADGFNLEAHRGLSDEMPENTMASFLAAAEVGRPVYQGMESDVQMTSDSVLVMFHDSKVDRTTDGTGKVSSFTFEELRALDAGNGEKVPTLECYLDCCRQAGLIPYIELKSEDPECVRRTFAALDSLGWKSGEYVITSFHLDALVLAQELCDAPLEYMNGKMTLEDVDKAMSLIRRNLVIRPSAVKMDQELVDGCRERGLMMEAYGLPVGDRQLLDQLIAWGVRGATCNSYKGLGR